jgi:hypothetical protein
VISPPGAPESQLQGSPCALLHFMASSDQSGELAMTETRRPRRKSKKAQSKKAREAELRFKREREAALQQKSDHCVLTFLEWCAINAISLSTGRRLISAGAGPVVTRLSPGRLGITVGNNRLWQESRAREIA